MDIIFGSEGIGRNDLERMEAVRREVGLDRMLGESNTSDTSADKESKREEGEKICEL